MIRKETNLNGDVIQGHYKALSIIIVLVAKNNGLRAGLNKKDDKNTRETKKKPSNQERKGSLSD